MVLDKSKSGSLHATLEVKNAVTSAPDFQQKPASIFRGRTQPYRGNVFASGTLVPETSLPSRADCGLAADGHRQ